MRPTAYGSNPPRRHRDEIGSLPTAANPGQLVSFFQAGEMTPVQKDLRPQYSDEYLAGVDWEMTRNLWTGLRVIYRTLGEVVEDISVDDGNTYFLANPGGTFTANPANGEPLSEPTVFPEPARRYRALEVSVQRRFGDRAQLFGTYVLSRNKGNYTGLFHQQIGQLDPNLSQQFDIPSLLPNADGLLPNERRHQLKVYGSYRWPFELITGFYAQGLSGNPRSKFGHHLFYGVLERFVTPRGSEGRTPAIWNLDLHFEYPLRLGPRRSRLRLIADAFNVTNQEKAVAVDELWTFAALLETTDPNECGGADPACPAGNRDYGRPTAYQAPRSLRLGAKLTW